MGKEESIDLSDGKVLKKFKLKKAFYTAMNGMRPGGYIDFYENNIFILSSRGTLAYANHLEENSIFKQIKNNLNNFIGYDQFKKNAGYSLRDLFIYKNYIYISYNEEQKKDCWNTSLLKASIDYKILYFEKFFSSNTCIHSTDNLDGDFGLWQSGGRISNLNEEYILLSVGEYGERYLAQKKDNINGKIIKINIETSDYEIISIGHRNPQGLYYDNENKYILTTEHGPDGGDEINLIELKKFKNKYIYNFGWPIVSEGEHCCKRRKEKNCDEIYKKYPLFKSHLQHGFDEPLISFTPSIAISQITKIKSQIN